MFTHIEHGLRKALLLSCDEYIILWEVYVLSNNRKYGGWCVKSKQCMADDLDMDRKTVFRIIKTLEEKGLVERHEQGWLRSEDLFNEQVAARDVLLGFKGQESAYLSGKVGGSSQKRTGSPENGTGGVPKTVLSPSTENGTQDIQNTEQQGEGQQRPLVQNFLAYAKGRGITVAIPSSRYLDMRREFLAQVGWWEEVRACLDWCYDHRKTSLTPARLRAWMRNAIKFQRERQLKQQQAYQDQKTLPPSKPLLHPEPLWTPPA